MGLVVRHGNNGWSCSDMGEENLGKIVTYSWWAWVLGVLILFDSVIANEFQIVGCVFGFRVLGEFFRMLCLNALLYFFVESQERNSNHCEQDFERAALTF